MLRTQSNLKVLSDQIIIAFWNLSEEERTMEKADTLLYDLAIFYSESSDNELKKEIELQFEKVCALPFDKPLIVMIHAYHIASDKIPNSPLAAILQNLISETAVTLEDWYKVADNEKPYPSMSKEYNATISRGVLKNIALQQILVKAISLDDAGYVVRNSKEGSKLHEAAILQETLFRTRNN